MERIYEIWSPPQGNFLIKSSFVIGKLVFYSNNYLLPFQDLIPAETLFLYAISSSSFETKKHTIITNTTNFQRTKLPFKNTTSPKTLSYVFAFIQTRQEFVGIWYSNKMLLEIKHLSLRAWNEINLHKT